jgi:hypothetical protein
MDMAAAWRRSFAGSLSGEVMAPRPWKASIVLCQLLLVGAGLLALPAVASARTDSFFNDLTVEVQSMTIDRVELDGHVSAPRFYRRKVALLAGKGEGTLGVIYQETSKGSGVKPGAPEEGLMLTAGWDHVLSSSWRLDLSGRVGLTGSDESQPLYAEDTDVRANLVWFDDDGFGLFGGQPAFSSGYLGAIVNRFGRVQAVGGVGTWWRGVGAYLTVFQAINGDRPRFDGTGYGELNFANLRNAGYSVSFSYEWRDLVLSLKRNFPIDNGSDDLTIGLAYRVNPRRSVGR